jgi:hypothetical protein
MCEGNLTLFVEAVTEQVVQDLRGCHTEMAHGFASDEIHPI